MPEHVLRCHAFVAKSFFGVSRNEDEKDSSHDSETDSDDLGNAAVQSTSENSDVGAEEIAGVAVHMGQSASTVFDRPKKFVKDDSSDAPLGACSENRSDCKCVRCCC